MSRSEEPAGDGPADGAPGESTADTATWRIERERHLDEWAALLGSTLRE